MTKSDLEEAKHYSLSIINPVPGEVYAFYRSGHGAIAKVKVLGFDPIRNVRCVGKEHLSSDLRYAVRFKELGSFLEQEWEPLQWWINAVVTGRLVLVGLEDVDS